MATATLKKKQQRVFGPEDNGILMTPREFDRADFDDGWTYELVNGVLIVSPIPSEEEVDPNEELGRWLRNYQEHHSQGSALNKTLPERHVRVAKNRRRVDRVIWAGLGRKPRRNEKPTIAVEFVSKRKRDRERDYKTKRDEFMRLRIQEYWIIDRFLRIMTVFIRQGTKIKQVVVAENEVYRTPLLPGFELPLARLLALCADWEESEEES